MLRNLLLCGILAIACVIATSVDDPVKQQFYSFMKQYNKVYTDNEEWGFRLGVFRQNLKRIEALNAKKDGATYGVTQFADMTQDEFRNTVLMRNLSPRMNGPVAAKINLTVPSSFDWRTKPGVVTPIYDQGQCGSCWAFSATENIESRWALAGHTLTKLSMQQIVDCDTTDDGCGGGWPYNAYHYVQMAGGIDTYSSYPYTAEDGTCVFNRNTIAARLSGWEYVTDNQDEGQMANYLVAKGPLSVCVDASNWSFYTGGVYPASSCGTSIDHCVDVVGYNLSGSPYWIIRNSWGTAWGLQGYMMLQYGKDACAVAQVVTSSIAQ